MLDVCWVVCCWFVFFFLLKYLHNQFLSSPVGLVFFIEKKKPLNPNNQPDCFSQPKAGLRHGPRVSCWRGSAPPSPQNSTRAPPQIPPHPRVRLPESPSDLVGTRHNSPPVSKCKRVHGTLQTGRRNYASQLHLDRQTPVELATGLPGSRPSLPGGGGSSR